jgi:hypothetical protein
LLGPSGERVVRASLQAAAPQAGLRPVAAGFGAVSKLVGVDVPGALDSGAYMPSLDEKGMPGPTITLPIEVKNRRSWIYPNTDQLYQLLYKAAVVQSEVPDVPIVPVLVCRKHHITTQWMAAQLGFFVVGAGAQFIDWPEDEDRRLLGEVQTELGYDDLVEQEGPCENVVGYLARGLPKIALRSAALWGHFGPALIDMWGLLRREIPQPDRSGVMEDLRSQARDLGANVNW